MQKLTATLLPGLELGGGGVLGNTEDCFPLEALTGGLTGTPETAELGDRAVVQ